MKTRLIVIALVAVSLLSFKLISSSKNHKEAAKQEEKAHSGFAMQDSNQF
ncbi:MAG TPA: hypothetical protein VL728_10235 [Cyclobacteriaceae bacterium]|jgi:hypothetical protein|nr:hypothetical protein [Cyclobacteriaceae bacterium]